MQRRIEIAHQLNDFGHFVGEGKINEAARTSRSIAADVFTYVIWPTLVENGLQASRQTTGVDGELILRQVPLWDFHLQCYTFVT